MWGVLSEMGADIDSGASMLWAAAKDGETEVVRVLIELGASTPQFGEGEKVEARYRGWGC